MATKKNMTLELLKLFASYMVVLIHISFSGEVGVAFIAVARFAVPLFFLISGFYSYQIPPEKIKHRLGHIVLLLVFATLCYTLFNLAPLLLRGRFDRIIAYLSLYFTGTALTDLVLFNVLVRSSHLWFLLALIYVYAVYYFVQRFRIKESAVYTICCLLLLLHLLLGEGLSAFGIAIPYRFVRNFALMGIPFFGLGLMARKQEAKLRAIPKPAIFATAVVGAIESVLCGYILGPNELYIGSVLILFALVVFFIQYSDVTYPRIFYGLSGCSTYIYIFHIMVSTVVAKVGQWFHIDFQSSVILKNLFPLLVCIASTIVAYVITQIEKFLLKKRGMQRPSTLR